MSKSRESVQAMYNRWWLGRRARVATQINDPFKLVTNVRWIGPPSGVYGSVELEFEDGATKFVVPPRDLFRPRKQDVEVLIDK